MSKLIDLTGKKFGKLLVLERTQDYISPSGAKKFNGYANVIVEIPLL